jgi:hypothetical protein
MSPWNPFKRGEDDVMDDVVKEVMMQEALHAADPTERGSPLQPSDHVVQLIAEAAATGMLSDTDGLTVVPYIVESDKGLQPEWLALGVELKKRGIALAYCEEPKIFYVDYQTIAKLGDIMRDEFYCLRQSGTWRYLLQLLWAGGFRLAKVEFLDSGLDIQTFEA